LRPCGSATQWKLYQQESSDEESDEFSEATNPKGDLSKHPDHYNTMQTETCVVHECDLEKVKAAGRM